ncbi:stage V sporulation protein AB [Salicibibacter cibarius]|uniref:Stage V sporulation protein AB n=1 Tax=Salicibibacter cibarius TaxID=2743000 RepID=A0A7T6Z527_9BACI|nr:stage V sporulation protein AB [Salicibibacter cibarius]QQK77049.1 stage V sporulation protein AB [Salicibibacter cibarius]
MNVLDAIFIIVSGFSEGLIIGAGLVAFLTILGVIQRLTQLTRTQAYVHAYQWAVILGSFIFTVFGQWNIHFSLPLLSTIITGIFSGMFVGALAAALTEVLNVLPVLAKRTGLVDRIMWLLFAVIFGKVTGSLFQWIIFSPFPY